MANAIAPEGHVYVCCACGKRSRDLYGMQRISYGWDESCMLNAELCREDELEVGPHGLVVAITRKTRGGNDEDASSVRGA